MAAPHVAGVVALMFQLNPELTAAQVKQILDFVSQRTVAGAQALTRSGGLAWSMRAKRLSLVRQDSCS